MSTKTQIFSGKKKHKNVKLETEKVHFQTFPNLKLLFEINSFVKTPKIIPIIQGAARKCVWQ